MIGGDICATVVLFEYVHFSVPKSLLCSFHFNCLQIKINLFTLPHAALSGAGGRGMSDLFVLLFLKSGIFF